MSVYKLVVQLLGQDAGATKKVRSLKGELQGLGSSSSLAQAALQGLTVGGLMYAGKQAAGLGWELGQLGARSKDVTRNLQAFAGGADKAARFMNAVSDASGRSVDDMTASATASRMLQMGIADTTGEMSLYVEGATRLGDQTLSASQRIGEMTQFLKNLNMHMADNFGLSKAVLTARTQELQATQGLTREEALLIAIQEEMSRQLAILGPRAEDGALAFDVLDASMANLKLTIGKELAPAMADLAVTIDDTITAGYQLGELEGQWQPLIDAVEYVQKVMSGGLAADEFMAAMENQQSGALGAASATRDLAEAQRLYNQALEFGSEGQIRYYAEMLKIVQASYATTEGLSTGVGAAANLSFGMTAVGEATAGATRELDPFIAALQGGTDGAWDMFAGIRQLGKAIVDLVPEEAIRGWEILQNEQGRITDNFIRNAVLKGDAEVDSASMAATAWEDSIRRQERAYDDLRSVVQSVLKPSRVSGDDMAASMTGSYADKWDENARRLDAIAARGQAELDIHPDWAATLNIPEGVLAQGEQALKNWATRTANAVRGLERPDLINIDAALNAVQQELDRREAVKMTIDLVTSEAVKRGMVSGPDAKGQIAAMLGEGSGIGGQMTSGLQASMGGMSVSAEFIAAMSKDTKANAEALKKAGAEMWAVVELGMYHQMRESDLKIKFAWLLAPEVANILDKWGVYSGGRTD